MQNLTKHTLKIYWQHVLKYKWSASLVVFLTTIAMILNTLVPLYYKDFFDILTLEGNLENKTNELIAILFIILGVMLLRWAVGNAAYFVNNYHQPHVMASLNNTAYQYLHKHSFQFFQSSFVGSLVKRVNRFGRSFEVIADNIIWDILKLTVTIVIILGVLTFKDYRLGLVIFVWTILFLALNFALSRWKLKYDLEKSEADTRVTAVLADTVTNQSNVKLFVGYEREYKKFADVTEKARKLRKLTWDLSHVVETTQAFFMLSLEFGIMYFAVILWQKGILTVGDFVLIQAYVLTIFHRVWNFGNVIRYIYEALADANEMTEILMKPHDIKDVKRAKQLTVSKGGIRFNKVNFSYHKTRRILHELDCTIKPKERVALVGPSGAGKSTIVKLIMRIYDITRGKIEIDGQKISHVTQESLWQNVSLVPQDPILFHRTLMENIRYGKPNATDEEVMKAAKLAHCDEFIDELPEKYKTYVGERGVKLSGGERQRVAIARAILKNSPILILDEATSSLDSESEHLIQDALENLMKGKTVIVIAHRLSTIMKMDRIIVLEKGKIVEQGSHKQLLRKKKGIYKKLWELQVGGFIQ